ncbi:hypothetical protein SDC9_135174 [bioreactor metagenome]|uniref:Uncharacterized protein n=1 Tax=bioreactor metagenome TaxID=1076179 RepID=A0A645DGX1_9ZZZZ
MRCCSFRLPDGRGFDHAIANLTALACHARPFFGGECFDQHRDEDILFLEDHLLYAGECFGELFCRFGAALCRELGCVFQQRADFVVHTPHHLRRGCDAVLLQIRKQQVFLAGIVQVDGEQCADLRQERLGREFAFLHAGE